MITTSLPERVQRGGKERIRNVKGIQNFGRDNLYPQNTVNSYDSSGALNTCVDTYHGFIEGRGMTADANFWKAKINMKGMRVDQLHKKLTFDFAKHQGFALLVHYNALYEKTQIYHVPFEYCRLAIPADNGIVNKIHVFDEWDKVLFQNKEIAVYDTYNPDPAIIQEQVDNAGGWDKWRGQILYHGQDGELVYPVNSFESVSEDVITDYLIKRRKNSNVSSNFTVTHYIEYPFEFSDQTQRDAEYAKYRQAMSPDSSGGIMILENAEKDLNGNMVGAKVHKIDVPNLDKLYEGTEKSIHENIRRKYLIPEILLNATTTGFSTEIMQSAYSYYNNITETDRRMFEQFYLELFDGFIRDINPTQNYEIITLKYDLS